MLDKDESYSTYSVKTVAGSSYPRVFNGDRRTGFSIIDDAICYSTGNGECEIKYRILRDDEIVYSVADNKNFAAYKIMGEATNEEITILLALLERFR
jgi:hypothetical protein